MLILQQSSWLLSNSPLGFIAFAQNTFGCHEHLVRFSFTMLQPSEMRHLSNHRASAAHYQPHRASGHGDIQVLCAHVFSVQQYRYLRFQPLEQQRATDGTLGQRAPQ
jgi:predicted transcriptional regulator